MGDFIRKNIGNFPTEPLQPFKGRLVFFVVKADGFFFPNIYKSDLGGSILKMGNMFPNSRLEGFSVGVGGISATKDMCVYIYIYIHMGVVPGNAGPPSLGVLKRAKLQVRTLPS